ncbi:hypothetical protein P353_08665 [Comamonas testosteroni]|uniref:Uncharacterized protein n=1 Tax=Comamonas testosteroni TaxID=285 RepID=A0A096FLY8_COMTE|nr:hypothetical protein P353_08665 [Comamonas testosteroni]
MQSTSNSRGRTFRALRLASKSFVRGFLAWQARPKAFWKQPSIAWPRRLDHLELAELVCHRGGVVNYKALMVMEAVIVENALRGYETMSEQDCAAVLSDQILHRALKRHVGRQAVRSIHFMLQRVRFDTACRYSYSGVSFELQNLSRRDQT